MTKTESAHAKAFLLSSFYAVIGVTFIKVLQQLCLGAWTL